MLQKTFSVVPADIANATVYAEAAPTYFAVWATDTLHQQIVAFEWFQWELDLHTAAECFQELKNQSVLLGRPLHFYFQFPHTAIVPAAYWKQSMAEDFISLQYGPATGSMKYISGTTNQGTEIVTRIFESIIDSPSHYFNPVSVNPAWVQVIDYTGSVVQQGETVLYLFFYPGSFTPVLYMNGSLQFIINQSYSQPESVLYTILNLLHQHNLLPAETRIVIAGMLEPSSPLFTLLYQYLGKIEIAGGVQTNPAEAFSEIPAHILLPFAAYHT